MDRVVGVLDQQQGIDAGVMHLRELVGRQGRGKLPGLAPHGVITEATGELALGPVNLAMQGIALHVADHLHQAGGLAFAVGVAEYPTVDVVGEGFRDTVRVTNALHLAVGLALQRGGLVQRVRYRDQVLALVIALIRALARAVRYRSTWPRAFHHRYLDL